MSTADSGTLTAFAAARPCDGNSNGSAGFVFTATIVDAEPYLHGRASRVESRTDQRDFRRHRLLDARNRDGSIVTDFQPLCHRLSKMNFGQKGGCVHDRDERAS